METAHVRGAGEKKKKKKVGEKIDIPRWKTISRKMHGKWTAMTYHPAMSGPRGVELKMGGKGEQEGNWE